MSRTDVIILGGGLIGLALAAALDSSGLSSAVVDPVDRDSWKDASFDGRTSAVSSSSRRMFDAIGLSAHLVEPACPIRTIRVADGLAPGALAFEPPDGDDEPLGWMHENRHLRAAFALGRRRPSTYPSLAIQSGVGRSRRIWRYVRSIVAIR